MYKLEKKVSLHSPIRKVWAALTGRRALKSWMGYGKTIAITLEVGGQFSFFDGTVNGRFIEIKPPNSLEYTWRQTDWPDNWPDSIVFVELKDFGKETQVRITHNNLPTEEEWFRQDDIWDNYFIEPMKEWSETGFKVIYGVIPVSRMRA